MSSDGDGIHELVKKWRGCIPFLDVYVVGMVVGGSECRIAHVTRVSSPLPLEARRGSDRVVQQRSESVGHDQCLEPERVPLGCSPNSPGPLGGHGRWAGGSVVENGGAYLFGCAHLRRQQGVMVGVCHAGWQAGGSGIENG